MARIEIYTSVFCGYCFAAKRLLREKGVEFMEFNVTFKPGLRDEMTERTGGHYTVPQIFVDGAHIGDCDELYALDRAGRLDPLLEIA